MRAVAVVCLLSLVPAASTSSTTWLVKPDGTGDAPTIQAGIDSAAAGDTVLVDVGTYHESITFRGRDVLVGSRFVVTGDTTFVAQTVMEGVLGSVVSLTSGEGRGTRLSGLTITGGTAFQGGGVRCAGSSPTLDHLHIIANVATFQGGGIYASTGAPLVSECRITGNVAEDYGGGGIACLSSAMVIDDNLIDGNQAHEFGGGIYTDSSAPVITNNRIVANTVSYGGSGIGSRDCTSVITDNYIADNYGSDYGGGLFY